MATRKIFKHRFVPEVSLTTEYINGSRYYVLPDGDKFRSVTTVISDKSDKTHLIEWKKRVGEDEAKKITTQAARRGTEVHSIAERYVLNASDYVGNAMPSGIDSFNSLKELLDKHVDNILGIELPLYSRVLNTAGRTDLIAEFDGTLSVVDFKTSRKPKREDWIENYFIQSTCYAMMFEWIYMIKVPQIAIMIAVDNEPSQLFVKNKSDYIDRVLEVFTQ